MSHYSFEGWFEVAIFGCLIACGGPASGEASFSMNVPEERSHLLWKGLAHRGQEAI